MSSDLFNVNREPIDGLTDHLDDVENYSPDLRVAYSETPETVLLDDCAVIDYLKNRGRRAENMRFGDNYFEGPQDIERLLTEFEEELLVPQEFQKSLSTGFSPRSGREESRLNTVETEAEHVNIEQIEPRKGFEEFDHADYRDKRIAEFAYENDAVIATYDGDFLDFPVNYTTPGMLL